MGTRSLTRVFDQDEQELVCMYRQYDGYLSEHGKELAEFLGSGKVVNGINSSQGDGRVFNGADDLAAQLVTWFKLNGFLHMLPHETAMEVTRPARILEMKDSSATMKASEVFFLIREAIEATLENLRLTKGVAAGGIYLMAPGTRGVGEDYTYEIFVAEPGDSLRVRVTAEWSSRADEPCLYDGNPAGLYELATKKED